MKVCKAKFSTYNYVKMSCNEVLLDYLEKAKIYYLKEAICSWHRLIEKLALKSCHTYWKFYSQCLQ